jgi:hypothetical protein
MDNMFDSNATGRTSPYLLRRRRSLQEAEADARHRYSDPETEAGGEADRLDNHAITER